MSNTNYSPAGVAADLLDVLRDALGPERRLPEPLPDYARFGHYSVTVRDGEGGRTELAARLTRSGAVREYVVRRVSHSGSEAVGPLRVDLSESPEESPSLTHVLPLVVRLEMGGERLDKAREVLDAAGYVVEESWRTLALRGPCPWGTCTTAVIELDPYNGAIRVHGREAGEVCKVLRKANVF